MKITDIKKIKAEELPRIGAKYYEAILKFETEHKLAKKCSVEQLEQETYNGRSYISNKLREVRRNSSSGVSSSSKANYKVSSYNTNMSASNTEEGLGFLSGVVLGSILDSSSHDGDSYTCCSDNSSSCD